MSDWPKHNEDGAPDEGEPKADKAFIHPTAAILPVLQNWQVLDVGETAAMEQDGQAIDGEATLVDPRTDGSADEAAAWPAEQPAVAGEEEEENTRVTPTATIAIVDQLDPSIVVTLESDHCQLPPGEEATYTLTILNNSRENATYAVVVEGWIEERWIGSPLPHLTLAGGERQTISIPISVPRTPQTTAGDRALAFIVRRVDDATVLTRRGAMLTILPYTNLAIGQIEPKSSTLSTWQKEATVTLPVTNRSNYPVTIRLQVRQPASTYLSTIAFSQAKANAPQKRSTVLIQPGQTLTATIKIRVRQQPLLALRKMNDSLQLIASAVEHEEQPYQPWKRTLTIPVTTSPLIGPWQLTSLVGLVAMILVAVGVTGMVALLLLSMGMRQPEALAQSLNQVSSAPPPIIVAYIQGAVPQSAGQPVAAPVVVPEAISTPIVVQPRADQQPIQPQTAPAAVTDVPIPILSADQISAPGSLLPAPNDEQRAPVAELIRAPATPAPATPAPMTYATMFHEIARRYDVNWRVLAAQAYVESGFDSVALGAHGDLGLMQIHPATWREWAPTVDAADPFDSYSNVLVAAAYFDYLRTTLSKRGHPEVEWTLVAYNWGIDKVLQHLESGQTWQALPSVPQAYATEVLRLAETIPANNE